MSEKNAFQLISKAEEFASMYKKQFQSVAKHSYINGYLNKMIDTNQTAGFEKMITPAERNPDDGIMSYDEMKEKRLFEK